MWSTRSVLLVVLATAVPACAAHAPTAAGVAPRGVYAFSGTVDGEVLSGTLAFGDPVTLSGSHGQCIREIQGAHRWGGPFGVTCPGISLRVRVDDDGGIQRLGVARIRKPGYREVRTTCRSYGDGRTCVAWNTTRVEYDRWVEGRVEVEPVAARAEPAGAP